ncbi:heme utilization protein HutZ [Psychromonas sp. RZ22]|uniref:heme utilization protein HutZ n=1 Tax=Psychromonas algarum TaxID=2555643 RepID=UPI0010685E34|nr:heme utilization protein HutZ [Psychromonas sp. RZ22]TEW54163.1 heme utilization protein HutZ [Psychromonas sp. RZ22]
MDIAVKQERLQGRLGPEIQEFKENIKTLQLATVNADGKPNVSYAPFVYTEDGYYVLISEIARHTQNILVNPSVSLMLIEDESTAKSLYARTRLTFDATGVVVPRQTEKWAKLIVLMQQRLGDTVNGLSQLADFKLIHLQPEQGLFVKGFGKAYQVSSDELVDFVHLEKGHQPIAEAKAS